MWSVTIYFTGEIERHILGYELAKIGLQELGLFVKSFVLPTVEFGYLALYF